MSMHMGAGLQYACLLACLRRGGGLRSLRLYSRDDPRVGVYGSAHTQPISISCRCAYMHCMHGCRTSVHATPCLAALRGRAMGRRALASSLLCFFCGQWEVFFFPIHAVLLLGHQVPWWVFFLPRLASISTLSPLMQWARYMWDSCQ